MVLFSEDPDNPRARGGLIIILKAAFLAQFDAGVCKELVPGRALSVHLQGKQGNLCIFGTYATSGADAESNKAREHTWTTIGNQLQPPDKVFSVLAGDFNFVENNSDRFDVANREFTGKRDKCEADLFRKLILTKGMCEIHQPTHTWRHGKFGSVTNSTAKLDRCYTSFPAGWTHTHEIFCDALPYLMESDHHPVRFGIRANNKPETVGANIPIWVTKEEEWPDLVRSYYEQEQVVHPTGTPWDKLQKLKQAFRAAAESIVDSKKCHQVKEGEELPVLITALKALEESRDLDTFRNAGHTLTACAGKFTPIGVAITESSKGNWGAAFRHMDKLIQEATAKEVLNEVERMQNLERDNDESAYSKLVARQSLEKNQKNDAGRDERYPHAASQRAVDYRQKSY